MLTELDIAKTKMKQFQQSETSTKSLLNGLQESVKERDRTIQQLKEQMKYYVAFAEQSVQNRQDLPVTDDDEDVTASKEKVEQHNVENLLQELQTCKEEIRCLNSHNSELKSQLEVISSHTDHNGHNGDRLSCSSSSSTTSSSEDSKDGDSINNNINVSSKDDIVTDTLSPLAKSGALLSVFFKSI